MNMSSIDCALLVILGFAFASALICVAIALHPMSICLACFVFALLLYCIAFDCFVLALLLYCICLCCVCFAFALLLPLHCICACFVFAQHVVHLLDPVVFNWGAL